MRHETVHTLETHFKDMQDTAFTVQDGVLFMLQTRNDKRTGPAALKIAVDMWREKLITEEEAVILVEPRHLDQLLHPSFADEKGYQKYVQCSGLPASPGTAVGKIVSSAADAEAWFARGENVMMVREETSPEDVGGMHVAARRCAHMPGGAEVVLHEGDYISVKGTTGGVIKGEEIMSDKGEQTEGCNEREDGRSRDHGCSCPHGVGTIADTSRDYL